MRIGYGKYIGGLMLGLLPWLMSCQKSEEVENLEDTFDLPVSFDLLQAGTLTTKGDYGYDDGGENPHFDSKPVRPVSVDQVKLNIYTRPKGDYPNGMEGFSYYKSQNLAATWVSDVPVTDGDGGYYVAQGVINLKKNYEYRVTAMAYNTELGEDGQFSVKETSLFTDADISITEGDTEDYHTPELFFGTPTFESGDTVFWYEEGREKEMLTGWLFRCVAGVELDLENVPEEVTKIELLADSLHTQSRARWYNDFKSAFGLRKGKPGGYVLDSWKKPDSKEEAQGNKVKLQGGNLLPVCTTLRVRITKSGDQGKDETFETLLRVREVGQPRSGAPVTYAAPPDGGNGTGIIPDNDGDEENPDPEPPDLSEYEICFKRNEYYRILADYKKLTDKYYIVTVTVNPNWDRNVTLELDKSENNNPDN